MELRLQIKAWRLFSISILQPNVCKEKQMRYSQCFEIAPIFHRKWRTLFISEIEIAIIYFLIPMFCVWKCSKSFGPLVNPFPWGLYPFPFPTVPTGPYWFPFVSFPHLLCSCFLASLWFLTCCANCGQFKALGIKITNSNSTIFFPSAPVASTWGGQRRKELRVVMEVSSSTRDQES